MRLPLRPWALLVPASSEPYVISPRPGKRQCGRQALLPYLSLPIAQFLLTLLQEHHKPDQHLEPCEFAEQNWGCPAIGFCMVKFLALRCYRVFCFFFKKILGFFFLEQFQIYNNCGRYRLLIYLPPPVSHTRGIRYSRWTYNWHVIITQSPQFTLEFLLGCGIFFGFWQKVSWRVSTVLYHTKWCHSPESPPCSTQSSLSVPTLWLPLILLFSL